MKLIQKKCNSLAELESKKTESLAIFESKNKLSSFDDNTTILIVGTYIPHHLDYYYFGNTNRIYGKIIDVVRGTDLGNRRKEIMGSSNKDQLINDFIDELKKQKIAFLDLFEYTLISPNKVKDNEIVGFTIDHNSFSKVAKSKNLELIIAISKDAEEILKSVIGNDKRIKHQQLINGGFTEDWIRLIKEFS